MPRATPAPAPIPGGSPMDNRLIIYPTIWSDLQLWAKFYHTKIQSSFCTARLGFCELAQEEGRLSGLSGTRSLCSGSLATLDVKHVKHRGEFQVPSALDTGFLKFFEVPATHSLGCQAAGPCRALHAGHVTVLCHRLPLWPPIKL